MQQSAAAGAPETSRVAASARPMLLSSVMKRCMWHLCGTDVAVDLLIRQLGTKSVCCFGVDLALCFSSSTSQLAGRLPRSRRPCPRDSERCQLPLSAVRWCHGRWCGRHSAPRRQASALEPMASFRSTLLAGLAGFIAALRYASACAPVRIRLYQSATALCRRRCGWQSAAEPLNARSGGGLPLHLLL